MNEYKNNSDKSPMLELEKAGVKFFSGEDELFAASVDNTRYAFKPDLLIKISSDEEIEKVLQIAHSKNIPVHIRGAGTGSAGGALAHSGGWVVDLSGLNFINIDAASRTAHVGAGAVTADINKAAARAGLFYAPDPSSHKYCTIGGNIACNAGGLRAVKYGNTRENVLALSAYLADGTRIRGGLPLKKFSAGVNLRDLFIGSEGTLGIVSEAWLKLLPLPQFKSAGIVFFESDHAAFDGIANFLKSDLNPSVMEFMDSETVECAEKYCEKLSFDIPKKSPALLFEFDGSKGDVDFEMEKLSILSEKIGAKKIRLAQTEKEQDEVWSLRRICSQAMYSLGDTKLNQDIVLPVCELRNFFDFYKLLGEKFALKTPVFGHAGDGNYHIHFMADSSKSGSIENARKAMDESIARAIALGGSVSGEHGIGILKTKFMKLQHSKAELETMRKIKRALDPLDILNRGKVLGSPDLSDLDKRHLKNLKLPWDKK